MIYMFSYRYNKGNTGGSGGVNYKLMQSNKEYKEINDLHHFFKEDLGNTDKQKNVKKQLAFLRKFGLVDIILKERQLNTAVKWIQKLGSEYKFKESDLYVFHDFEAATSFKRVYPHINNCILVYHQQGSLYNEWCASLGINSFLYKGYLDYKLAKIIDDMSQLAFPSEGSREILMDSSSLIKRKLEKKEYSVLYNGIEIKKSDNISEEIKDYLIKLKNISAPKFASVSNLNYAKGVEKIPQYLYSLKNLYSDFCWVIVGNGVMREELQKNIEKYGLSENIIWINHPITNEEVHSLLRETDYYVMLHRWSIFDLATLEAMGNGNVPILSNIGGNPEVLRWENGFLVNETDNDSIVTYVRKSFSNIENLKEVNIGIQKEYFSTHKMLMAYKEMINQFNI